MNGYSSVCIYIICILYSIVNSHMNNGSCINMIRFFLLMNNRIIKILLLYFKIPFHHTRIKSTTKHFPILMLTIAFKICPLFQLFHSILPIRHKIRYKIIKLLGMIRVNEVCKLVKYYIFNTSYWYFYQLTV